MENKEGFNLEQGSTINLTNRLKLMVADDGNYLRFYPKVNHSQLEVKPMPGPEPSKTPTPGFEAVFSILSLLAVVLFSLKQKKQN
ncbi:MAG: hypothetical protein KAS29_20390 [Bacteroidales bacterium]|nr:hypothetical protein [Bacteroidales bacterium]